MANPNESQTPPLDFIPVSRCVWAEYSEQPPEFLRVTKHRGRRLLGVKFEKKAQAHLCGVYGDDYLPSQWIRFRSTDNGGKIRWCQPDGIIVDKQGHALTIVEIKYSHTEVAWWQLFHLYLPVLEKLFDGYGYEFRCVELCKWFDAAIRCPQRPRLCEDLNAVKPGEFAVHIWSK